MENKVMTPEEIFQNRVLLELQMIRDTQEHHSNKFEDLDSKVAVLQADVAELKTDVAELKTGLSKVQTNLAVLTKEFREFRVNTERDLEILRQAAVHWRHSSDKELAQLIRRVDRIERHLGLN